MCLWIQHKMHTRNGGSQSSNSSSLCEVQQSSVTLLNLQESTTIVHKKEIIMIWLTSKLSWICKAFKIFIGFFEHWNQMKVKESYRKLKTTPSFNIMCNFFEDVISYLKYYNLICFKSKVHNPIRAYRVMLQVNIFFWDICMCVRIYQLFEHSIHSVAKV